MSTSVHITRIKDTQANVIAGLDDGQTALLTDQKNEHVHRVGSNFYYPAVSKYTADGVSFTYVDADFDDLTVHGDNLDVTKYIRGAGDTDTRIEFVSTGDSMKFTVGGTDLLTLTEDTTSSVTIGANITINTYGTFIFGGISGGGVYFQCQDSDKDMNFEISDGGVSKRLFKLDADVAIARFPQDAGFTVGAGDDFAVSISSDDVYLKNATQNKDIYINVNDGGVDSTAMFIDGSENNVYISRALRVGAESGDPGDNNIAVAGAFLSATDGIWRSETALMPIINTVNSTLADDASVNLKDILACGTSLQGFLFIVPSGTTTDYGMFIISLSAATLISGSYFDDADTDGDGCVFHNGSHLVLKNRRGTSTTFEMVYIGRYSS
jgi:hypothetical protein